MNELQENCFSFWKFSIDKEREKLTSHLEMNPKPKTSEIIEETTVENLELDNLLFQNMNTMRNSIISSQAFQSLEGSYSKCFEIKSGSVYINVSLSVNKNARHLEQQRQKPPQQTITNDPVIEQNRSWKITWPKIQQHGGQDNNNKQQSSLQNIDEQFNQKSEIRVVVPRSNKKSVEDVFHWFVNPVSNSGSKPCYMQIKRPFSIFKSPNRFGLKSLNQVQSQQLKGFQDKVRKIRKFWTGASKSYPVVFFQVKEISNQNGFERLEIFDISKKMIPEQEERFNKRH